MPNPSDIGKIHALAASLRLPNLPSVWSNTLTGVILACLIFEDGELQMLGLSLLSASCLYFAGNLLNDWADHIWDSTHRPERALPSRVFQPNHYLLAACLLILLGLGVATFANINALWVGLALTACILIYTWSHKRTAWSVIPMALCRALLPVLGFVACSRQWDKVVWVALPALLLFIYLILLSLRARSESQPEKAPKQTLMTAFGFILPPLIVAAYWYLPHFWTDALLVTLLASIPYLIWVILSLSLFRKPVPRQVSALLAGIPLIDSLFLLPYLIMGFIHAPNSAAHYLPMMWLVAFVLGRLLQRYVPAT